MTGMNSKGMNWTAGVVAVMCVGAFVLAACNESGLKEKPRANFAHLACLDVNGDGRINGDDAEHVDELMDFNADDEKDDFDAAFVRGVDIPLAADAGQQCEDGGDKDPEYLVAHDWFRDADVSCQPGESAALILGVAGGVDDLKDDGQAEGVRDTVDELISRLEDQDIETIGVIAGAALYGAENAHAGMEDWLTNAVEVYFDRFPCLRLTMVGFSHGGVTVAAVASRVEEEHADRIVATVVLDRIEDFYGGDLQAMPRVSPVINVYQTNTPGGFPVDAPNVFNYDASGQDGPEDKETGETQRVTHVTLDNSEGVRDMVAGMVVSRATGAEASTE